MSQDIHDFVANWLPAYVRDKPQLPHRGDRLHRRPAPLQVYIAEWLAERFRGQVEVIVRHRSTARRAADRAAGVGGRERRRNGR